LDVIKCPACGRDHNINKQHRVKCICKSDLVVLKNGKSKVLVREEDKPKVKSIKCKNCIYFYPTKEIMGDCMDLELMKRNVNGDCITVCKRFKGK
jgi:hypothetical protein